METQTVYTMYLRESLLLGGMGQRILYDRLKITIDQCATELNITLDEAKKVQKKAMELGISTNDAMVVLQREAKETREEHLRQAVQGLKMLEQQPLVAVSAVVSVKQNTEEPILDSIEYRNEILGTFTVAAEYLNEESEIEFSF
jgi:hypothetical protein